MSKTLSDEVECCRGVCKPRDTAMFDNLETRVAIERAFSDESQAQQYLAQLQEKAKAIESEPCQIESKIEVNATSVILRATFNFSCQAEAVIFQLALR